MNNNILKKVIIGEDNVLIGEHLKDIVESFGYEVIEIFQNKIAGLNAILKRKPDLALLDINMGNKYDGIEIAEFIQQNSKIPIIFITAHSDQQTISKAIKTKPSGYILKPFKDMDVFMSIKIAFERDEKEKSKDFIIITEGTSKIKIFYDKILYLKSDNNYIEIFTLNKKYLTRNSLQGILNELNSNSFIRTHRSFAINAKYASKYQNQKIYIKDILIPVSRKYIEDVKKIFEI